MASSKKWLKNSDDCYKFFHAVTKENKLAKRISGLFHDNGVLLSSYSSIQVEVCRFYACLMGTASKGLIDLDPYVVRVGPVLSSHDASSPYYSY